LHSFLIHVDGKASRSLFDELNQFSDLHSNVLMLPDVSRVNISWGGHNMVRATLNGMARALELKMEFDWLCNLSGASYPLSSNEAIRKKLSELPSAQTTMMEINPKPSEPSDVRESEKMHI
jgi:hypothetical protein